MAATRAIGLFRIGNVDFALPAEAIAEVLAAPADLADFPQAPRHVRGAFNHRGRALPMVDLGGILRPEGAAETAPGPYALVLRTGGGRLAVQVDAVRGVVQAEAERFTPLASAGPRGLFQRAYTPPDGGRIAVLLELPALAALDGVSVAADEAATAEAVAGNRADATGQSMVVFRIGAVCHGLPAAQVGAVERRPEVLGSPLGGGMIAGYHRLRGRFVPVVRTAQLLGSTGGTDGRFAVIVQAGERAAALLVDEIVAVEPVAAHRREGLPEGAVVRPDLFAGCWSRPDGEIALWLDGAVLAAEVGAPPLGEDGAEASGVAATGAEAGPLEQFLVFRCNGWTFAAVLRDLDAVIRVEDGVVDLRRDGQDLAGMCTSHGRTVRLVDLGRVLGAAEPAMLSGGMAICVAAAGGRVGFLVQTVDLLVTTRARPWTGARPGGSGRVPPIRLTIPVKRAAGDRTAGVLDLGALARQLRGTVAAA